MGEIRTLAIDIGGTGIKAAVLDEQGHVVGERERVPTPPKPIAPDVLMHAIDEVTTPLAPFDRVSVGFPGYVRDGVVLTAPNLGTETLGGFNLQEALSDHWGKPVKVLNDADVQGFGAISGNGIEMVLTLGTGAGTAIFRDGEVIPHLELAHHPVSGKRTYDEYVGNAARRRKGKKAWSKRVAKVIDILRVVVRFDHLYIGGGNAKDLTFPLPPDVSVVSNTDGLTGGIELWRPMPPHSAAGPREAHETAGGGSVESTPEPAADPAADSAADPAADPAADKDHANDPPA